MSGRGFGHEKNVVTASDDARNEWYTPKWMFDAIALTFDLDPCSPGQGKTFVPAKKVYTIKDDGLISPWNNDLVFVNPPYGKDTGTWIKKLSEHGNGIGLVFARTDVKWFQEYGAKADLVCFVSKRVRFYQGGISDEQIGGSPGAGSMLLAFGETSVAALKQANLGACFTRV